MFSFFEIFFFGLNLEFTRFHIMKEAPRLRIKVVEKDYGDYGEHDYGILVYRYMLQVIYTIR